MHLFWFWLLILFNWYLVKAQTLDLGLDELELEIDLAGGVLDLDASVTGSVDEEEFFHFHDSEFTADARDLEIVQSVDVAFRRKLLLRVKGGPIPLE